MGLKTIGETLKEARVRKRLSLNSLSVRTKIRKEFLEAIEKGDWNSLPDFSVVLGFVKSVGGALELSIATTTALLKRDYVPQTLSVNPKPDVSKNFIWSPKLTFWLGIIVVSTAVLGYLIYQYIGFISPPNLEVDFPPNGQVIMENKIFVSGKTESGVAVKVNNQPTLLDDNGNFSTEIEVVVETKEIVVVANSRSGKETVVRRSINVELEN